MNNKLKNILSLCLCLTMVCCLVGNTVMALNTSSGGEITETDGKTAETEATTQGTPEIAKDETVYVLASADGSVKKIIVSDWISNAVGAGSIADKSDLTDIANTKGEEGYTIGGDNTKVWDAAGNDIYYRGDINKELPVNLNVTYKLDGKAVTAEELKGKSGKVTIRFLYENRQYEKVTVNGREEIIYVPFVMLTGILVDNDVFTNVEVSNGKLVNDGNRTAVMGIALPGMQNNLGISREKFEIPDYVEITADVKNFSLGMTVTIATNDVFSEIDTDNISGIDDLTKSLDSLTAAMNKLIDGSSELYAGLCTLLDKSGELIAGINSLAQGALALKSGAEEIDGGAEQLKAGAEGLASGLGALASNNSAINGGAKQVFDTMLQTAKTQLTAAGISVPDLTVDNYSYVLTSVISTLNGAGATAAAEQVTALKTSLDSYNTFYEGLKTYTAGVQSAASGAAALKTGAEGLTGGTKQLSAGANELYSGILKLQNGAPALLDGITQLKDGSMRLSDGLKAFDEQGVKKLVDAVDGDLGGLVDRIKATVNVSKNYKNFSGISDEMDGKVKFIYRTESIGE